MVFSVQAFYFVKYIALYFVLFYAVVNEAVIFNSFLCCSLLVYGNTIDFHVFVWYPTNLINSLSISSVMSLWVP